MADLATTMLVSLIGQESWSYEIRSRYPLDRLEWP
jgi:hypothetical protein